MGKLLLLLTVFVLTLTGCSKKDGNDKELTPFEESLRLAFYYGIDTVDISYLKFVDSRNTDKIQFNYIQTNKLKVKQYCKSTKELLGEVEDNETFKWEIKYNVPYVGEVIDTIKDFVISYDNNLVIIYYLLNSENSFSGANVLVEYCFIRNNLVCKKIVSTGSEFPTGSGVFVEYVKKWYADSWMIKTIEWAGTGFNVITKDVISCCDKYGELLFNVKSSVVPNISLSLSEGILVNELIVDRLNIQTGDNLWSKTINLNIPETAKYELVTSELVDTNTVQAIYNITFYDGTKTTKTVKIDVNTGEYTVI